MGAIGQGTLTVPLSPVEEDGERGRERERERESVCGSVIPLWAKLLAFCSGDTVLLFRSFFVCRCTDNEAASQHFMGEFPA